MAGGYAAESEVRRIAAGLGLAADRLDLPIAHLSGGERRRVDLARILFGGSDVLLLDEPTNHLDVDAKQWLMTFLRSFRGALLVVSHDLALLDQAITRVLHLDEGELIEYRGTYSQYLVARAGRRGAAREARDAPGVRDRSACQHARRLDASLRPRRAPAPRRRSTSASSDSRGQKVEAGRAQRNVRCSCPSRRTRAASCSRSRTSPRRSAATSCSRTSPSTSDAASGCSCSASTAPGKTTLLRTLVGELEPDLGEIRLGYQASLGYYAQEHEGIARGRSVLEHVREVTGLADQYLRALLGMFGLRGDLAFQDAGTLSGGEKTKLALAMLVAGKHNLLLLDEPTNNLDPPSRTAIGGALREWKGAMVIVSHDTEFVAELAPDRVLLMPEGTVDHWSDDLLDLVALA